MTGTGTQADPLVIMNVDDLYALETAGGSGKYAKLGADIDFNGTQYADNFQPITLNCIHFDGNGKTIRNIYANSLSLKVRVFNVIRNMTVMHLNVENCVIYGSMVNLFEADNGECTITTINCRFAVDFSTSKEEIDASQTHNSLISGMYTKLKASLCSFTVRASMTVFQPVYYWNETTSGCTFFFDITFSKSTYGENNAMIRSNMTDCGFLGTITYTGTGGTTKFYFAQGGSLANCYSAIVYSGIDTVYWNTLLATPCVWRTTDNSGITLVNSLYDDLSNLKQLTLDQMKDITALRNAGFDVQAG